MRISHDEDKELIFMGLSGSIIHDTNKCIGIMALKSIKELINNG